MEHRNAAQADVYLIAVRDFVVLRDLEDTVREFDPDAVVLTSTRLEEAIAQITAQSRLALAFVEAGPARVAEVKLDALVRSKGGRIVLLGDDAEDEWDGERPASHRWPTLLRPFSSQTVLSMIVACRG
ncbi:MAG: hypothetical protein KDK10_12405 [Maritimibacter sp.]|nr:hypothetical protein [Maritimibacter sp.]